MKTKEELYQSIIKLLDEIPNEDENMDKLEKAMTFFCGNYDICEGMKHAIALTLDDQYRNHQDELEKADLVKLENILTQ